jgi:hypothetical protein
VVTNDGGKHRWKECRRCGKKKGKVVAYEKEEDDVNLLSDQQYLEQREAILAREEQRRQMQQHSGWREKVQTHEGWLELTERLRRVGPQTLDDMEFLYLTRPQRVVLTPPENRVRIEEKIENSDD